MPVETPSLFSKVIQDHLELKQKNSHLEDTMPINEYKIEDPFDNHPLFKTEEQARIEETMDGVEPDIVAQIATTPWPGETAGRREESTEGLWGRSRDFDWGD
jgi:hypothetical protein